MKHLVALSLCILLLVACTNSTGAATGARPPQKSCKMDLLFCTPSVGEQNTVVLSVRNVAQFDMLDATLTVISSGCTTKPVFLGKLPAGASTPVTFTCKESTAEVIGGKIKLTYQTKSNPTPQEVFGTLTYTQGR